MAGRLFDAMPKLCPEMGEGQFEKMIPREIIIHHSLTTDSGTVSWGAIRTYHVESLGWSDIGYHWGIEMMRGQCEIVMGRMPDRQGAHCVGHNDASIGVCFVGNFDFIAPQPEQWEKGVEVIKWLMREFRIPPQNVKGHRYYNNTKTCPGRMFDMGKLRADLLIP